MSLLNPAIEQKAQQYAKCDGTSPSYEKGRYIGYYSGYVDGVGEAINKVREATMHLTTDEQDKIVEALLALYEN